MRLSIQDKNEFLKAALKAPDRDSLARWIVSVVDAIDSLPEGKSDAPVPVPPFHAADPRPPAGEISRSIWGNGQAMLQH